MQMASAQPSNREIVNQPIEWFALSSNLKISKTFAFMLEGQFRYADDFDPQQFQFRTALDVKLNDHFSIVPVGYVYTWNSRYGKQPAAFGNNEHRIWEQIFYKHAVGKVKIDHRLRLEQRFIQAKSKSDNDAVDDAYSRKQGRLRYRLMARMPLKGSSIAPKTYFLSVYEEVFVNWGHQVTFHEPDQNRVFAGLGYQFNKALTVQGGFLYQMLIKSNGTKQENNVGFQLQFGYNFDFTKPVAD